MTAASMSRPPPSLNPLDTSATPEARPPSGHRGAWKRTIALAVGGLGVVACLVAFKSNDPAETAVQAPDVPEVEGSRIVFSEAFAKRVGLKRTAVRLGPLTPVISVVGTVDLNPEHLAAVGTRVPGLVRSVRLFEGDTVKQGEVLAEIDSAELGEAQAAVVTVRAEHQAAEINARRELQLLEKQLSTAREAEVAQVELKKQEALLDAAQQRVAALGGAPITAGAAGLGRHAIVSPIAGTVISRHVSTGQSVGADLVAFSVADIDHLWVELSVFERNLSSIKLGDAVELSPLSDPEQRLAGRVAHIGAQINPDTRSAVVRITVDNHERKLRPGQAITAEIHASVGAAKPVLIVPNTAVTVVDGQPTVFISDTPTSVRAAPVTLGQTNGDEQQIIRGLNKGQMVVSEGIFALKSELFR